MQQPLDVMSVDQAAKYLGVSTKTLYEYAAQGAIPHRRLGRRILLSRQALLEWLKEGEPQPEPVPAIRGLVREIKRSVAR